MKRCTRCGRELPLTAFNKHRRERDGLNGWCRDCTHERDAAYYLANSEKIKARANAWYYANRERAAAAAEEWRAAHPKAVAASKKKYREANRLKLVEASRTYRANHYEQTLEATRAWHRAHLEEAREKARLRVHLKRASAPDSDVTLGAWQTLVGLWDGHCVYCGTRAKMTQDHVRPLTREGAHMMNNLLPACLRCNQSKGNRLLSEWPRYQRLLVG